MSTGRIVAAYARALGDLPQADAATIERRRNHACSATVLGASPAEALGRVERACLATIRACEEAARAKVGGGFGSDPWLAEWPSLSRALHDVEQSAQRGLSMVAFVREMHDALNREGTTP